MTRRPTRIRPERLYAGLRWGCSQVGGYLRVLLHGRRQRQMEDMEYYLAIR